MNSSKYEKETFNQKVTARNKTYERSFENKTFAIENSKCHSSDKSYQADEADIDSNNDLSARKFRFDQYLKSVENPKLPPSERRSGIKKRSVHNISSILTMKRPFSPGNGAKFEEWGAENPITHLHNTHSDLSRAPVPSDLKINLHKIANIVEK